MKRPRRYLPLTRINWKLNSLDLFQLDEVAARFDTLEELALDFVYLVSCSTPLIIMFLFFFSLNNTVEKKSSTLLILRIWYRFVWL